MADKITEKFNETVGEGYTKIKHKSGLDIYIIPKNHSTSYAAFASKYGSFVEKFKLEGEKAFTCIPDGTAHFLEHKMFENEDGEDTFAKYARYGASPNAYTSCERTAYIFSCTSNEHENLEILLNLVESPYFTEENIAKEQGIIGQEIGMYNDDPDWQLYMGVLQGLYKSNPTRIDIAGTTESIAKIDKELLYKIHGSFYDASNMVLVVCGKFDKDKVTELCDRIIPASKKPKIQLAELNEPKKANKKKVEHVCDISKPMFTIGIKDNNPDNTGKAAAKKCAATEILSEYLFGIGSDFYCNNYKSGLINDTFGTSYESCYAYSHYTIGGEADNPDAVYKAVKETLAKAVEKGIPKADFERCKRVVYARSIMMFENVEKFANKMVSAIINDIDVLDFPQIVFAVKASEVNARAKELFVEDAMTISIVKPAKK